MFLSSVQFSSVLSSGDVGQGLPRPGHNLWRDGLTGGAASRTAVRTRLPRVARGARVLRESELPSPCGEAGQSPLRSTWGNGQCSALSGSEPPMRASRSLLLATGSAAARCGGGQEPVNNIKRGPGDHHQPGLQPVPLFNGCRVGARSGRGGVHAACGLAVKRVSRIEFLLYRKIRRTYCSNQPPELFSTGVLRRARACACAFFAAMTGVCTGRCWGESDVIRTCVHLPGS